MIIDINKRKEKVTSYTPEHGSSLSRTDASMTGPIVIGAGVQYGSSYTDKFNKKVRIAIDRAIKNFQSGTYRDMFSVAGFQKAWSNNGAGVMLTDDDVRVIMGNRSDVEASGDRDCCHFKRRAAPHFSAPVVPKPVEMTEEQKDWLRSKVPLILAREAKSNPYIGLTKTVSTLHFCLPSKIGCTACLFDKWERLSRAERKALGVDIGIE